MSEQQHLERIRRATRKRAESQHEWRQAIVDARAAGVSYRTIAKAAGISHVRVLQIARGE